MIYLTVQVLWCETEVYFMTLKSQLENLIKIK